MAVSPARGARSAVAVARMRHPTARAAAEGEARGDPRLRQFGPHETGQPVGNAGADQRPADLRGVDPGAVAALIGEVSAVIAENCSPSAGPDTGAAAARAAAAGSSPLMTA